MVVRPHQPRVPSMTHSMTNCACDFLPCGLINGAGPDTTFSSWLRDHLLIIHYHLSVLSLDIHISDSFLKKRKYGQSAQVDLNPDD